MKMEVGFWKNKEMEKSECNFSLHHFYVIFFKIFLKNYGCGV